MKLCWNRQRLALRCFFFVLFGLVFGVVTENSSSATTTTPPVTVATIFEHSSVLSGTELPNVTASATSLLDFFRSVAKIRKKWRRLNITTMSPLTAEDVSIPMSEELFTVVPHRGRSSEEEEEKKDDNIWDDVGSGDQLATTEEDPWARGDTNNTTTMSPSAAASPVVTIAAPPSSQASNWTMTTTLSMTTSNTTETSSAYNFSVTSTKATTAPTTLPPCPERVDRLWFPERHVMEDQLMAKWSYKCHHRTVSFNVTYARLESSIVDYLQVIAKNVTIGGLRAHTTYTVCVCVIQDLASPCDLVCATETTKSARPGRPENVTIIEVTNSTMAIRWEVPEKYVGPTNYTVHLTTSTKSVSYVIQDVTEAVVDLLAPYTNYCVMVEAVTDAGSNWSSMDGSVCQRTEPGIPGAVPRLVADCGVTECELQWEVPLILNGIFDYYNLTFSGIRTSNRKVHQGSWNINVTTWNVVTFRLRDLKPDSQYTFTVRAKTVGVETFGTAAVAHSKTMSGIPMINGDRKLNFVPDDSLNRKSEVKINLTKDLFSDDQGDIVHYAIIVSESCKSDQSPCRGGDCNQSGGNFRTWSDVRDKADILPYFTSPRDWNPFCDDDGGWKCSSVVFIIGNDTTCFRSSKTSERCNGPLRPGLTYSVKVRAYTLAGFAESDPCIFTTDSSKTPVVVISIFVLFLTLLFVTCFVVSLKRRNIVFKFVNRKKCPGPRNGDVGSIHERPIPIRSTSKPISTSNFRDYIKMMSADSGLKFSQEFEELNAVSAHGSTNVARLPENKAKNRWINILPFDESRVKLLPIPDDVSTDYINASYIPGYRSPREYIATQGPLPSTKDDFWRMVWEQNSPMIVMATQCIERGKIKCEEYWPTDREKHYYGDLAVRLKSESILSGFTIRIFDLELTMSQSNRCSSSTLSIDVSDRTALIPQCPDLLKGTRVMEVKQMHFTMWPDFGCPDNTTLLLNFVRSVRDHLPRGSDSGPIVVHCSAGVGRTGTFIAVDWLMQHVCDRHDAIDVYRTVRTMRQHRTNMVQTEDQYVYIHECIGELLREQETKRTRLTSANENDEVYTNLEEMQQEELAEKI